MDTLFSSNYIVCWSVIESYARCTVCYYSVPKLINFFGCGNPSTNVGQAISFIYTPKIEAIEGEK